MNSLRKARKRIEKLDKKAAKLFCKRMEAVKAVALYKREKGLEITDTAREEKLINGNTRNIKPQELRPYYIPLLQKTIELSKKYQHHVTEKNYVVHSGGGYEILVGRGVIKNVKDSIGKYKKVAIITDSGVPAEYSKAVAEGHSGAHIITIPMGEENKNFDNYKRILSELQSSDFSRSDCVVAVGGGVVGDMAGFAAATFMRGMDFYNVPTTLLSQLDSSIGGKTAIDFEGIKNSVGAFWQPKKVFIDIDTLKTLPDRQVSNGLAEAVKMALTSDKTLFEIFENEDPFENIEVIINRALSIKSAVVEADEREVGLRRVLNFGHTIGHAIESVEMPTLLHGESVGLGMLYMCSSPVRERLLAVLKKLNLPTETNADKEKLLDVISHDKKMSSGKVTAVYVEKVGSFEFRRMSKEDLKKVINEVK